MFRSLRARLLLWYTAILAIVIAAFGGSVCYGVWRTRLADVDARLGARARLLAAAVQPAPEGTFDLARPAEDAAGGSALAPVYHALWTMTGDLIDRSDAAPNLTAPSAPGVRTQAGNREVIVRADRGVLVLAGVDLAATRHDVWSLAGLIASVGAGALALSLAGGWLLVGRALAPLHATIERQRRFTADASHELRTPLTSMSAEVQWALARDRDPSEYREALATCQRSADRMAQMVKRLLALARADAGAETGRVVPVRLDDVVRTAVEDLRPFIDQRQLTATLTAPPTNVIGDPDRLLEAVGHVLANAVQYNVDQGSIRVTLRADRETAVLEVVDTGVGISSEDLPRVFEPFYRADPARSRDAGGAGLGLAVARAIVRRHGGEITCSSQPAVGTTVAVSLPAAVTS